MGMDKSGFDNVYKEQDLKLSIIRINMLGDRTGRSECGRNDRARSETQMAVWTNYPWIEELLLVGKVQNWLFLHTYKTNYTNYPEGHDIIGNHIVINEDIFQ